jgi:hypothetical protein
MNAINQPNHVEVDQQPLSHVAHPQVGQELLFVQLRDLCLGLVVHDDFAFNDQVQAQRSGEPHLFVFDRHLFLSPKLKASLGKLLAQRLFIDHFDESRA